MCLTPESKVKALGAGRWLAMLALGFVAVGCVSPVVQTPAPVGVQPAADEAIEIRNWPRTVAMYHSGTTQAFPTNWVYQTGPASSDLANIFVEPVMMVVQTCSLPVTLVPDPLYRRIYYRGDVLPESYNAMPPLPPEPAMVAGWPDPDPLVAPAPAAVFSHPIPVVPEEQPMLIPTPIPAPAPTTKAAKPAGK